MAGRGTGGALPASLLPAPDAGIVIVHQFVPAHDVTAYCALAGIPHAVINSSYPICAATGELPQVQHGSVCVGGERAWEYVRKLRPLPGDAALTVTQQAEETALLALIRGPLRHALQWCENAPDSPGSRAFHTTASVAMPFPLNYLLPWAMQRR